MPFIEQLGQQAAGNAVGQIMGLALGGINDRRQLKQQKKLQAQQIAGSKELTDYNYAKQLQMWKDTNYSAQVGQLREAGLNPGLLYGMSGGGGVTTGSGSGSSASGGQAQQNPGEAQAMGIAMNAAQIRLMEAQAKNLDVDSENKAGVERTRTEEQTNNLIANTKNVEAQRANTNIDTSIKQLQYALDKHTFDARVDTIETNLSILEEQLTQEASKANVDKNTVDEAIKQKRAEAATAVLETSLTQSKINLTDAQIKEIIQSIQTQIEQIKINKRQVTAQEQQLIINRETNRIREKGVELGAAADAFGSVVGILTKTPRPKGRTTETFTESEKGTTTTSTVEKYH